MAIDELLKDLQRRKGKALEMGGAGKVSQHRATGSGTARGRIAALLDQDSFYEIGLLNHSDVAGMEAKTPADGKICGFGAIDGRPVAVVADDATVLAGSGGRIGGKKTFQLHRLAVEKGYPLINLGEGGGARIPDIMGSDNLSAMTIQADFDKRCRRVPTAATIMGECYGGPSWVAAQSDFVVRVKGSCMAVSGPARRAFPRHMVEVLDLPSGIVASAGCVAPRAPLRKLHTGLTARSSAAH